ncbi:MAG: amidase family protein [Pseudomonadota bacterium]
MSAVSAVSEVADGQLASPADWSVAELGAAFRDGTVSPVAVADAALARIDAFDDTVNAFVFQDRDTTMAMAAASEARHAKGAPLGPLDGVPTSIKDLAPVAGWPLQRGSRALSATEPAPADSPPVARLREAGAVFIGKTATPESGTRIVTRSEVHGLTCNPYGLSKTPGGSSGGAAAALALSMGTLALGTDGAGSIRIPAAFCNLCGLKPGFGRVPSAPPSIFMPHSVVGPMARRAADVAAMAAVMSGAEPRDPYAWPVPFDPEAARPAPLTGMRIALSPTLGTNGTPDSATLHALRTAARAVEVAGATVEDADPHLPCDPYEPFMVFWEATYAGFLDSYPEDAQALMSPLIHEIAARGRRIDILTYHRALGQRVAIAAAMRAFYQNYDAVLAPVMPSAAFDVSAEAPEGEVADDWRWCPFTYLANMTGEPAVSIPTAFTEDGLPLGVQLMGPSGSDETLLRVAAAVEPHLGVVATRPSLLASRART